MNDTKPHAPGGRPGWKDRLSVLDDAYTGAVRTIVDYIDSLDEAGLRQLRADLKCPTTTNCSWTLWAGKDIALMFVEGTEERRRIAARDDAAEAKP